jgi:hypothetical protein
MDGRKNLVAGVDYRICHQYLHTISGTKRWGTWVCQCVYTNKYFVINSLGPFVVYAFCTMTKDYRNLIEDAYRFDSEKAAIRFMSRLNRFIQVKSAIRDKANSFKVEIKHYLEPYSKASKTCWDEHSVNHLEDMCTATINVKKHQILDWELTLIFNFLIDEIQENSTESYQVNQNVFFEKLNILGGQKSVDKVLDNYFLIKKLPPKHAEFWIFEEEDFDRLIIWNSADQKLVMSLAFAK